MRLFREFFLFELKFRFKSISTYVYFAIWFFFSFLCIASENFGPIAFGNGKVLLNGPFANLYNDTFACFFGLIIIGAIFGTSILRDFQRDTTQILFTKPISKFGYLGGRWAGSPSAIPPSRPGSSAKAWWVISPVRRRLTSIRTPSRGTPCASGGSLASSPGGRTTIGSHQRTFGGTFSHSSALS